MLFSDVVRSQGAGSSSLPKSDWQADGKYPVIGQGESQIEGWSDREDLILPIDEPIVVYGGHTRRAKYVDHPFVPGPNVRILTPESNVDARFLFYFLSGLEVRDKGYGDHFPLVRSCSIPLPSLGEQKRIVATLDKAFAALDRARANAEANLADAETVFEQALLATFDELLAHASMSTLADMSTDFSRGKSKHRPRNDPKLYGGAYPFIQTGDVRRSEGAIREYSQTYNDVGLAQSKLWPVGTVCITIAANIAETGVLEIDACFPDSVIGMVPDPAHATPYYVEYMLRYFSKELKLKGKGSAQDNINLATFEDSMFPFPSLAEQAAIVDRLDDLSICVSELRRRYSRQMEEIDELRQSLLQAAFSGQLS